MKLTDALHIHLDYETYSEIDLTKVGVDAYAHHPSTDVLLADYAIGDGQVRGWRPGYKYPFAKYHDRLGDDVFLLCWNSRFERIMWWRVMTEKHGWPGVPLEAFICVAAWARSAAASPSKLELAAQFFDVPIKKYMKGHHHMLKMCRPATDKQQVEFLKEWPLEGKGHSKFMADEAAKRCHHTPINIDILDAYCADDVGAERGIAHILPEWEWPEIEAFWESERINDHGLCVDVEFAKAATAFADEEKVLFNERLCEITKNQVQTPRQFQRFKDWALPRMSKRAIKLTEWYDKGVKKNSFDADVRSNLLAAADDDPDFLDVDVWDALDVLDEAGKSTISKYASIAARATDWLNEDGEMRANGSYMFAGAAQSGRYSSMGTQWHNTVRDVPKDASTLIDAFVDGESIDELTNRWKSPIHALGTLVRPTIWAPEGKWLVWGDWSSIEAIALPWLSLDPDADETLERARRGEDIYLPDASAILGKPVGQITKDERQAYGKVPRLSLGYGGADGAFKAMAKGYGVRLPDDDVKRIVKTWRASNPWAPRFWKALEGAAMMAMERPGVSFAAGRVEYVYEPDDLGGMGCLYCILPSGRRIPYPDPDIEVQAKDWGDVLTITCRKGSWRPAKGVEEWPRIGLWRGLLAENATQAACADILNDALLRAPGSGLTVCGHTHDELLVETDSPKRFAARLKAVMETKPDWPGVDALPLRAEVEYGIRYKVADTSHID